MKKRMPPKVKVVSAVFAIIALAGVSSLAQSGRSIPKRPQTVAVPTPEPTPLVRPKPKPDFNVKVVIEITHSVSFIFPMPERMQTWFMERLEQTPLLDVRGAIDANRRDAINLAEKETDTHVIWLQLENDPFGAPNPVSQPASGQVWINLSIFSPVTGKTKFSRKIVLNQNTSGGVGTSKVIRSCHGGVYGNDYLLLEASLVAAESVMMAFNIPIPPDCKSNRYPI